MTRTLYLKLLGCLLMLIACVGCGGGGGGTGVPGTLKVVINWPVRINRSIPEAANSIVVTLRSGSYNQTETAVRPPRGAPSTLSFRPPSGQVHTQADAFANSDGSGTSMATFSGPIQVAGGQTTTISLAMGTTIVSLTVAPNPIAAVVGQPSSASAYGRDAQNSYVLLWPGEVTWQSVNPGVATVASTGAPVAITGIGIGTTQLRATDHETGLTASGDIVVQAPGLQQGTWAREGGDNRNTRRGAGRGATGTGRLFGVQLTGNPTLGLDGSLYGGRHDGNANFGDDDVSAYDGQTGNLRWTLRTMGPVTVAPAIGADGTIFAPSGDGDLHAIDQAGVEKWHVQISARRAFVNSSPVIAEDGTVYIGCSSAFAKVSAIDGYTGQVKWTFPVLGLVRSLALGADGTVYFGSQNDDTLFALNPNGTVRWRKDFGTDLNGQALGIAPPMIGDDGTVYAEDTNGTVYAFDGGSGSLRWSASIASDSWLALGMDGTVYATTTDAFFFYTTAIDGQTGATKWSHQGARNNTGGLGIPPVVASDGTIYASGALGTEALNPSTGGTLWTQSIGTVAALAPNGNLVCVEGLGFGIYN